jgi:hypothetical protein
MNNIKILSLIIIAILAISAIGSVSAATNLVAITYPDQKNAIGTSGSWRWTGDDLNLKVHYYDEYEANHVIYSCKFKKGDVVIVDLSGYQYHVGDGTGLMIDFGDATSISSEHSVLYVNNWDYKAISICAWDRGNFRLPHFEGYYLTYNATPNIHFNNGNGGDYTLNL